MFGRLLYADIVRGEHSTGVYAGFQPAGQEHFLKIKKAAIPSDVFLRRKDLWGEVREHKVPSKVTEGAFTTLNPKFMIGHNRFATQGEINDENAHPFQHGHITLVHNGTLTDQTLLPDHKRFAVDSENVAWSIYKIGIDDTIQKLNGAFTLVWHDSKEKTLNIIRNDERPFHLLETSAGDWFGASEEDMLMWLATRKKSYPSIKKHFECEVGVQYIFDVSDGFKFKEERKHKLPTFRSSYYYSGRGGSYWNDDWSDYGYGRRNSTSTSNKSNLQSTSSGPSVLTHHDKFNELLESHGIRVKMGEKIKFEAFQFDEYPKSLGKGKMTGYTGFGEYVEVQAHGVNKEVYEEYSEYFAEIISCYEQNYILTIIVKEPSKETLIPDNGLSVDYEDNYDDADDEDSDEVEITLNGEVYSKKEWESGESLNTCANCSSPIPFDDIVDTVVDNGNSYCNPCAKAYGLLSEDLDKGYTFVCRDCSNELHTDLESCKDGVCIPCLTSQTHKSNKEMINLPDGVIESDTVTPLRKKLKNGMSVTPKQWLNMNNCGWCSKPIQWVDAQSTEFLGQQPCCSWCSSKLELGIIPK